MDRVFSNGNPFNIDDLREGGMFLVDKPLGWTSFDVVNKLRYAIRHKLGQKRYKIGHAGTLDPLATGLLLLCFSKYTKKIETLMVYNKAYEGTISLWATTPSYDAELAPDVYYPHIGYRHDTLRVAAKNLTGLIQQLPPIYSAIKKNGVPLYKLARQGKKTEINAREVHIHSFELTDIDIPDISFKVACSKGTYIRSLAYDYGQKLGNGAYLSKLRRTAIGSYKVDHAWQLDDLVSHISKLAV